MLEPKESKLDEEFLNGFKDRVNKYIFELQSIVYFFIAVFNCLLPVKAALHYGGLYINLARNFSIFTVVKKIMTYLVSGQKFL